MDTESQVDNHVDDGQKRVEEIAQRGFPITAAFWLKASANEKWYFYLVARRG